MGFRSKNFYKLFTKEDSLLIHKFLGISCLCNFLYRYYYLFIYGDMGFNNTLLTPISIILHGLLSISSLIF